MQRRHNCSPAASFANCFITLYLLKVHLQTFLSIPTIQKCQILSCDTLVSNERYVRKWVFFECNCDVTFNNKYLNYVIFYLHLTHIYSAPSQFNNLSVLVIVSQFTKNAQNAPHLTLNTCGHVWSWTVARIRSFWDGCEWVNRHKKCASEESLFSVHSEYT